jgi:hypothetical protein
VIFSLQRGMSKTMQIPPPSLPLGVGMTRAERSILAAR